MFTANRQITIHFEDATLDEAGRMALSLQSDVRDASKAVKATLEKEDPSTQDFGSVLVLVLGTPAILAVASGIADWLRRERASITIKADGEVVAKGIRGEDAARIAEAMAKTKLDTV